MEIRMEGRTGSPGIPLSPGGPEGPEIPWKQQTWIHQRLCGLSNLLKGYYQAHHIKHSTDPYKSAYVAYSIHCII